MSILIKSECQEVVCQASHARGLFMVLQLVTCDVL